MFAVSMSSTEESNLAPINSRLPACLPACCAIHPCLSVSTAVNTANSSSRIVLKRPDPFLSDIFIHIFTLNSGIGPYVASMTQRRLSVGAGCDLAPGQPFAAEPRFGKDPNADQTRDQSQELLLIATDARQALRDAQQVAGATGTAFAQMSRVRPCDAIAAKTGEPA